MTSLSDAACPLYGLDPDLDDDSDLEVLREIVGDARMVFVGESAHWASDGLATGSEPVRTLC